MLPSCLSTERLLLRRFQESDFEALATIVADPETMQYVGAGYPKDRVQARQTLSWISQHWQKRGYGLFALKEKQSGAMIGWAGFIDEDGWPDFELGWVLSRGVWGRGYATEAASTLLIAARDVLQRPTVISMIRRPNARSIRVAQKLGMAFDTEIMLFEKPIDVYRVRF